MGDNELTYEQAFSRLEEITRQLEGRSLSLEESLAIFEEGVRLCRTCLEKLQGAEQRVERILLDAGGTPRIDEQGRPLTEPFPDSDGQAPFPPSRKDPESS